MSSARWWAAYGYSGSVGWCTGLILGWTLWLGHAIAAPPPEVFYPFFRVPGNNWTYAARQVGPEVDQADEWTEVHTLEGLERWGGLMIVTRRIRFFRNGKERKKRNYRETYVIYRSRLFDAGGLRLRGRTQALEFARKATPLMRWIEGKTWHNRADSSDTYQARHLRSVTVPAGTYRRVKVFSRSIRGGQIVRSYYMSPTTGMIKFVLKAHTKVGTMITIKELVSSKVQLPKKRKR